MRILRISILFIASLLLFGCGPMYQTVYHYRMPKNRSDRHCVSRCRIALSQCKTTCRIANQNCQNQQLIAEDIASRHRHRHDDDFFYDTGDCNQSCGCRQTYNACYEDCGGKVIPESVCVFNCPAPAASSQ